MGRTVGQEVGSIIRDERRARGMTQARLAKRAGLVRETVYRTENGRLPTPDVASRLCDALGIDRDVLDLHRAETDAITQHPASTLLRDRRRKLGLTLKTCAEAAGVSEATLSRFERGIERSSVLVAFDQAGWPSAMVNEGLARALGFDSVPALTLYWRTGRG